MANVFLVSAELEFRGKLKYLFLNSDYRIEVELDHISELGCGSYENSLVVLHMPFKIAEIKNEICRLKQDSADLRIVMIANNMKTEEMAIGFSAGADAYLLKEISPNALIESIKLVMLGEKVFPSQFAKTLCPRTTIGGVLEQTIFDEDMLSSREVDVVQRLGIGMPNKVIADELHIAESTVKVHLKNILKKLRVENRTQAAIWALQHGLCTHPSRSRYTTR